MYRSSLHVNVFLVTMEEKDEINFACRLTREGVFQSNLRNVPHDL